MAILAHLAGFLSQVSYYNQAANEMWRHQRSLRHNHYDVDQTEELKHFAKGQLFFSAGVVLAIISLACFAVGSGLALWGVLPK